jgi:hypothetical protein
MISFSGYAFFDQTRLTISASSNISLRVMVDGRKYTNQNGELVLSNLPAGYHAIKIFMLQKRDIGRDRGGFGGNHNNYQLAYNNSVYIKPQYHTDITINRFGKVLVDEQLISNVYYEDEENWGDDGNTQGGYNNIAMSASSFDQFKQTLRRESFDDTKLSIAKQVISNNWFSANQVKELITLFTFENSKLDMAKYAYKYTIDRGNYFIVLDAFTFNNSKEELMQFMRNYK